MHFLGQAFPKEKSQIVSDIFDLEKSQCVDKQPEIHSLKKSQCENSQISKSSKKKNS